MKAATQTTIDLAGPVGQRLLAAGGKIESGMLANMRTYRLPAHPAVHCRIVGEGRTLCGRSLQHNEQWAWQFIHRGQAAESLPSGMSDRDTCKRCAASPIVVATAQVVAAKRAAWRTS